MTTGPYKPFRPIARFVLHAALIVYTVGGIIAFGVIIGLGIAPMIIAAVEKLP